MMGLLGRTLDTEFLKEYMKIYESNFILRKIYHRMGQKTISI